MTDQTRSNDPFEHVRTDLPTKTNGIVNNWGAIPPDEISQCKRLGVRASALVGEHARCYPERRIVVPHPIICAMDWALVHLTRPLRLKDLENASDPAFMSDFIKIAQHIDRDLGVWDASIQLDFYAPRLQSLRTWFRIPPRSR